MVCVVTSGYLGKMPWCCFVTLTALIFLYNCLSLCIHVFFMFLFVIVQQKLAKRDGGSIDRSQDITLLQEFYKTYRKKYKAVELHMEEIKLRESHEVSGNLGEYVSVVAYFCSLCYFLS